MAGIVLGDTSADIFATTAADMIATVGAAENVDPGANVRLAIPSPDMPKVR